ncbi:MAG: hypothetical protein EU981_02030 [Candidatus Liberibacter ctenarytainae]|uniref:EamA domain-containing protein n=1 Tax=Candidatus Liberibacter ctenarytainae TaxID=2020335 RepID=A0A937AC99_9HYPH|nr:hypothetical protein [Candidatus Liberibacter ctenarytainae]
MKDETDIELASSDVVINSNGKTRGIPGVFFVLFAHLLWGMTPLYTNLMDGISLFEIIAHRVIWSLPGVFFAVVYFSKGLSLLKSAVKNTKVLLWLAGSAFFLACHWGVFLFALLSHRGFETALSFYISPLLSIALGSLLLNEKWNKLQVIATSLTTIALLIMTIYNGIPVLSLAIAVTWSVYCFTRKSIPATPNEGMFIEMCCLAVPALLFVLLLGTNMLPDINMMTYIMENKRFLQNVPDTLLLMGYGLLNSIAFCFFAYGIKNTRLSTVGIMDYVAPTMMAINTVIILKQPVSNVDLVVFFIIVFALFIYVIPSFLNSRKQNS